MDLQELTNMAYALKVTAPEAVVNALMATAAIALVIYIEKSLFTNNIKSGYPVLVHATVFFVLYGPVVFYPHLLAITTLGYATSYMLLSKIANDMHGKSLDEVFKITEGVGAAIIAEKATASVALCSSLLTLLTDVWYIAPISIVMSVAVLMVNKGGTPNARLKYITRFAKANFKV